MRQATMMAVLGTVFYVISAGALLWRSCLGYVDSAEEIAIKRQEPAGNISRIFDDLLKDYDKRDRPFIGHNSTVVKVSFGVVSFSDFKEADMELKAQMHIRQVWTDPRLAHNINSSISLHLKEDLARLWLPDFYLANAKKVVQEDMWLGIISPSGEVYNSFLATVTLGCKMNFVDYPMDQQICPVFIESYGYVESQLEFQWYQTENSVSVFDKNLAEFEVTGIEEDKPVTVNYISGPYKQLAVRFTFTRRMGYYLLQIYIPCILIVTSSWTIFWMEPTSVTDRSALGVSSVLSIVFLLGTSNSTMPRVSYIKAIDWFMIVSFVFVFLTVIECVVVYKIEEKMDSNRDSTKKQSVISGLFKESNPKNTEQNLPTRNDSLILQNLSNKTELQPDSEFTDNSEKQNSRRESLKNINPCKMNTARFIDRLCRALFPLSYIVFNIGYWITYLPVSGRT